jgi:hypothetical protein
MVSSVWWREAGAASDWRAHPHDGSEREKPEPKFESFEAEMFADCDDLHGGGLTRI